ncbi:CLUMA_CG007342, isoform A [Clunio marinus]|uniref:CLUMA_CG007342, isoform A n=1 Tax=Clunio marinus TaxID=568069 RepID=A0A1J1I0E4_9DIPT|nr:CLUMA_CG007342, isoform A [Clunio marinus]
MGNILQRNSPKEPDVPTPQITALTPDEVDIIKATWKIPSANAFDSAETILYTFLERFPEHQPKFSFRDVPLSDLKGTPGFRNHASKIFNVFSSVVDALDRDPDYMGIKRILAEIGKFHAKKKITKKSQNDLRSVVVDILTDVCKLDEQGKIAWTKLLDIFFHVIFECLDGRADQF